MSMERSMCGAGGRLQVTGYQLPGCLFAFYDVYRCILLKAPGLDTINIS